MKPQLTYVANTANIILLILTSGAYCIAQNKSKNELLYTEFINGSVQENVHWLDDRGEIINAHDGGILYDNEFYYWYGMALRPLGNEKGKSGAATTTGINLYSSVDLYNWKYEGIILSCSTNPKDPLYGPMRFERPKIIYNAKTKKFVMWFHYVKYPGDHADSIGYGDAGVAVAESIKGPFFFQGIQRPVENAASVKDCTLFQDEDGTAYFIYDHKIKEDRCLYIVKLTDDYLHCTETWSRIENCQRREAPAVLKYNGNYYLITSGMTSWTPNPALYYRSESIMGPYENVGDPCEGPESSITYNSQPTYVLKNTSKSDSYIIMLERHNTKDFTRCSYIWLPLEFPTNRTLKFKYQERWKY